MRTPRNRIAMALREVADRSSQHRSSVVEAGDLAAPWFHERSLPRGVKSITSRLGRNLLGLTALLTALSACGSGSSTSNDTAVAEFALAPAAPQLAPGDRVQFAVTAAASADVGQVTWAVAEPNGGTIDATGRYTAPDIEGAFTVIAASAVGKQSTAVHVTRHTPAPVISSFTASPSGILQGGSATLSWNASGATSVSIDDGTGPVTAQSPTVVTPSATTTYTLTATNRTGSVTAEVVVTVSAAPVATPSVTTPSVTTPPATTPAVTTGAGTTHQPTYLTGVTGGGAMPSAAGAPTASCAGDGTTDVTACLQNAINSAAAAGKPLLIPATSSYYKISTALNVTTSLIGTGGMPTIKTIDTEQYQNGSVLHLADGFSGWVYNIHAIGTWDGTTVSPGSEYNHGINVGCVNGVTIMGNLLEKVRGDGISTDGCVQSGGSSQNVLVANNTTKDTWRCGIAFTTTSSNWVVRDNLIDKQVNYVAGIDFEPWKVPLTVTNVEVLYNKFNMNNRTALASPASGSASGTAVFGWGAVPSPGGSYWVHHNYGTFGTGFGSFDGGFVNVTRVSNAEGSGPPN
jgi:Right handed beta helix region